MKEIKILWAKWRFRYVAKLLGEDGDSCRGTCDLINTEIRIERLMSYERKKVTVFHELLHALSYMAGLDLSEDQVRGLSHNFFTVMKENPWLVPHMVPNVEAEDDSSIIG